jgi:hypothetical protein
MKKSPPLVAARIGAYHSPFPSRKSGDPVHIAGLARCETESQIAATKHRILCNFMRNHERNQDFGTAARGRKTTPDSRLGPGVSRL